MEEDEWSFDRQQGSPEVMLIPTAPDGDSEPVTEMKQLAKLAWKGIRSQEHKRREAKANQKPSRTFIRLQCEKVDREAWGTVLWQEGDHTDAATRRALQCMARTYPVESYLQMIGIQLSDECTFCKAKARETLTHWQCECEGFHDIRTKVHDDIWRAASAGATSIAEARGWRYWHDRTLDKVDILHNLGATGGRKPDGVFWHQEEGILILTDLARTYADEKGDVRHRCRSKKSEYQEVLQRLDSIDCYVNGIKPSSILFIPLVCSYDGAIEKDGWYDLAELLGMDLKERTKWLVQVAEAIFAGLEAFHQIRMILRKGKRLEEDKTPKAWFRTRQGLDGHGCSNSKYKGGDTTGIG
jgi:hypothetical protein